MKKVFYTALLALTLSACADAKKDEKAIQKEVLDYHDKVMDDDHQATINKMKLDTLIHKADSLKTDKQEAMKLSEKLTEASDGMSDWMVKLNLDNSGKNHDDIMKYWKGQKAQVEHIDSLYTIAINESTTYIQKTTK
jgi:GTPase involved in cell partitioning and DNA repair